MLMIIFLCPLGLAKKLEVLVTGQVNLSLPTLPEKMLGCLKIGGNWNELVWRGLR